MSNSTLSRPVGSGCGSPIARPRSLRADLESGGAVPPCSARRSPPSWRPGRQPPRHPLARSDRGHRDRDPRSAREPRASRCADSPQSWEGPGSVYWYVDGKDEVLSLACDALVGEALARAAATDTGGIDASTAPSADRTRPGAPRDLGPHRRGRGGATAAHRSRRSSSRPSSTPGSRSSCRPRQRAHPTRFASGSGSADLSPPWG